MCKSLWCILIGSLVPTDFLGLLRDAFPTAGVGGSMTRQSIATCCDGTGPMQMQKMCRRQKHCWQQQRLPLHQLTAQLSDHL